MNGHVPLTDDQLEIRPGDTLPVRAAKVSLKTGRQLKKADDPEMVKIVTGQRPSAGSAPKMTAQPPAAPGRSGFSPLLLWHDLLGSSSPSTGHPRPEDPHAILFAAAGLGRCTVVQPLLDKDETDALVQHFLRRGRGHVDEDEASSHQEQVEDWRSERWPS